MLTNFVKYGLTVPVIGTVLLYAIGHVYHATFLRSMGFSGYTGGFDFRQLVFINIKSLILLGAIAGNLLGFLFVHDYYRSISSTPGQAVERPLMSSRPGKLEATVSVLVFAVYASSILTFFATGRTVYAVASLLGLPIAGLFFGAIIVSAYDLKWVFLVFGITFVLFHAAYCGVYDAENFGARPLYVKVATQTDRVDAIYVGQDLEFLYIISDGLPVSLKKDAVINIVWPVFENKFDALDLPP